MELSERSTRRIALVAAPLLVIAGVVATLFGVGTMVNAATQTGATVIVPVAVQSSEEDPAEVGLTLDGERLAGATVEGAANGTRIGSDLVTSRGTLLLRVPDATTAERVLSRGDYLVRGAALLVAALALRPVLRDLGRGTPFGPGAPARVGVVALCVAVGGIAGPVLPGSAASMVLSRIGAPAQLSAVPTGDVLSSLALAALVLLVGAAVRRATPPAPAAPVRPWAQAPNPTGGR